MVGVADPAETDISLVEPRRRQFVILAIDGVFVLVGVAMMTTGEGAWGLAPTLFFGLGLALALLAIAKPARLELHRDGFVFVTLGRRSQLFEWSLCSDFHAWAMAPLRTLVAFEYAGPKPLYRGQLARVNRSLAGGNCSLPSTYGWKAADLCRLLSERQARAGD
jgi:hypothetical protein